MILDISAGFYTSTTMEYELPLFIDINECQGVTCVHGTCVDGVNSFTCHCETGWEGKLCDSVCKWRNTLI